MAYATEAGMKLRFGEAEIDELLADGGATAFVAAADAADAVINGYLATRYTLPLVTVPVLVRAWAEDLTRYNLWDERSPDEVRRRQEEVLDQLRLLSDGKINLPPGVDSAAPEVSAAPAYYSADRVFTSDTLSGF